MALVIELTGKITEVRRQLAGVLAHDTDPGRVKDGLYLDLALEEALRTVIERQLHPGLDGNVLLELIGLVQENLLFQNADAELAQCGRELARLPGEDRFSVDWAMRAKAVVDRLRRAVEGSTDAAYQLLQPKAVALGREFNADGWTVELFSEEIVRGRPVFVLSMLLHLFDPVLRKSAQLGDWQVISPSRAAGEVTVVPELRALQGRSFDRPTVVVADQVHGDEEPPEGACAVLTPRSVDLVSHVAVRARNAELLFATCFDAETFAKLKQLEGRHVELSVTSSGDVKFAETTRAAAVRPKHKAAAVQSLSAPQAVLRVLRRSEFERGQVGGKSWHIRQLAEKLPGSFQTPRSVALPYGVFDAVLADQMNRATADRFRTLLQELGESPEAKLAELRQCILGLELPAQLLADLDCALEAEGFNRKTASRQAGEKPDTGGLPASTANCIKQVWASLWNDRAYFSRQTNGLPHHLASMAVLVQEVVEAEYAFVIHTVNPATGNPDEIYAEIVRGLGETLVGNYPGRALSFVAGKSDRKPRLLAYPSKSLALRGGGWIFRSDSNVEDLEGYAGAGLYDSVLLEPAREERLDYTRDPLVWDAAFQQKLFAGIAKLGCEVERAFGGPQDIEGAWVKDAFHVVQTRPQVGVG
ncbi:MAG: hypothetical protein MUC91_09795 [Verrucomicrobia bacterium]|nr:hypothetical protein [Verrucomicrobiota bacterium]